MSTHKPVQDDISAHGSGEAVLMTDHDLILDALTAIRDSGLCTDRRQLNRAWRELIRPDFHQEELT